MPVIQAQDIVNAAIQDSQVQTTNRPALYDYTDRIHQRILRESQWRFLLSDPQHFVTMPGVSNYTLVSGTAPAGSFQTNNLLSDFGNLAPGTIFNVSTWNKLEEDSDTCTTISAIVNKDGSRRTGIPKTYSNSLDDPGTITLFPVPDGDNFYYPIPETPVVTYSSVLGCTLPSRIYYGVVTFVDSLGGESTQCNIPFTIQVPAGCVVTIHTPDNSIGSISGNQTYYGFWNLYIGYSMSNYYRQNTTPIQLGTNWVEPIYGINAGYLPVPLVLGLPPANNGVTLQIQNTGDLVTTVTNSPVIPSFWALVDSNGVLWTVTSDPTSFLLQTVKVTQALPPQEYFAVYPYVLLTDTSNISTWKIAVDTTGLLKATLYSTPPSNQAVNGTPPTTSTIQPLNAYVIQFRYYQTRNKITNPTDVLQIPYAYKDIVIAGVNYLTAMYIDIAANREPSAKTLLWKREFDAGLAQIRRDLRVSYRKTDFISPDVTTQYVVGNQQGIPTMGW